MSQTPDVEPLLAGLHARLTALASELRALAGARWQLARLELGEAWRHVRALAIVLLAGSCGALIALALLAVAAADALADAWGGPRWAWLLGSALFLLLLAAGCVVGAWRRFRRRFVGLAESLEELQEDLVWLGEHWPGR